MKTLDYYNNTHKLRVGLLLNERLLEDWEYGIFYLLFSDPRVEVIFQIQDARRHSKGFDKLKSIKFSQIVHYLLSNLAKFDGFQFIKSL